MVVVVFFTESLLFSSILFTKALVSFIDITILFDRPGALMVEFSLISDASVSSKILLQRMVDTLRKGGLKNRDDPSSTMITVDVRGFNFKGDKGSYFHL